MFNSKLLKVATLALTLGSTAVSATTIDLFTDVQAEIAASGSAHPSSAAPSVSSTADGVNMIGGERDIYLAAGGNVKVEAFVGGNELNIASSIGGGNSDIGFTAIIQWDGDDNNATPNTGFDKLGLGARDLSALDGFLVSLLSSDDTGTFIVDLWDATGEQASVGFSFIAVDPFLPPVDFFIDFGFFTGESALNPPAEFSPIVFDPSNTLFGGPNAAFDFSQVSAMRLVINGEGQLDLRVASISAVPAPGSLALMGLALLGFAGFARRKV